MKRICVFCGSSPGKDLVYREAAVAQGRLLAREGIVVEERPAALLERFLACRSPVAEKWLDLGRV